jgi:hypothetical protein
MLAPNTHRVLLLSSIRENESPDLSELSPECSALDHYGRYLCWNGYPILLLQDWAYHPPNDFEELLLIQQNKEYPATLS